MFRFYSLLVIVLFSSTTYSQNIFTEDNFPDPVFREIVSTAMGGRTEFTAEEAKSYTDIISIRENSFVTSIKGLEFFENIQRLYIENGLIIDLDLSKHIHLRELFFTNSPIEILDISLLEELESLNHYCPVVTG